MIELYGIPNCDTMKKARRWLDAHGLDYRFHDYKKEGVDVEKLRRWVARAGWETLLNRRGMMWRKLPEDLRAHMDETRALEVMQETPSIIKRPVLEKGDLLLVGFKEADWAEQLL